MTDYIKISPAVWDNARLPFLGPVASLAYIMLVFLSAESGGEVPDKEAAKQWGRFGIEMDEMKTVIKALESDGLISRENGYITVTDFEKIVKASKKAASAKPVRVSSSDCDKVVDAWNSMGIPSISKVTAIGTGSVRSTMLKSRLKEYGLDAVLAAIENVKNSPFLQGACGDRNWRITFDWFVKPSNFGKVLDGNYNDGKTAYKKNDVHEGKKKGRFDRLPDVIRNDLASRGVINLETEEVDYFCATLTDQEIFVDYDI